MGTRLFLGHPHVRVVRPLRLDVIDGFFRSDLEAIFIFESIADGEWCRKK